MQVYVLTAAEAAAADRRTIERGVPSRALMQRAGAAAAGQIARRYRDELARGVAVFAGAGNNGGDAWVVARSLAASGYAVRVREVEPARTEDAIAEREAARAAQHFDVPNGAEGLLVDGVLGTGARGELRGAAADAVSTIARYRAGGARVVALDLPSGLHADLGTGESVVADLTLSFGALKRGLLLARERCGMIDVLDIGLDQDAFDPGAPVLADEASVLARIPRYAVAAHKGDRRRVAIVGGAEGMAGAVILAARAALRSGAGLARVVCAPASVTAVQAAVPEALANAWGDDEEPIPAGWAHAMAIGPGLGMTSAARSVLHRLLHDAPAERNGEPAPRTGATVPVVIDADALNILAHSQKAGPSLRSGRGIVATPHPAEMGRLMNCDVAAVQARRFEIGAELAKDTGAVVLLKGAPTVISAPDGRVAVVATGTPALATGGSGDVLSGVVATLLAQMDDPFDAAVCAAWAHGRAAELANAGRSPRGIVLGDIIEALGHVWYASTALPSYPALAELPAVPT